LKKERKEERKEKGEMTRGFFSGQTHPSGCSTPGFPWLLSAIKSCFNGESLNFMYTPCVDRYLVD
jgi:hypothetical protein